MSERPIDDQVKLMRLMRTAPRLLAALQGLLVGCEYRTIQGITDWHVVAVPSKNALSEARAAIADAMGGAS